MGLSTLMENERVKVLKVTFEVGEKAAEHSHPDHVIYVINGGKAALTIKGKTEKADFKTGEAIFLKAQSHAVENIGKTKLDLIVVELKK